MRDVTRGDWRPSSGMGKQLDGYLVVTGDPARPTIVADCRRLGIGRAEQQANAALMAKSKKMARALLAIEDAVGDLPSTSEVADRIYLIVAGALKGIDLTPPDPGAEP